MFTYVLVLHKKVMRTNLLRADRGERVGKSTRHQATAGDSPITLCIKPTCLTEMVWECREIPTRMNCRPEVHHSYFFQWIHGQSDFSIYFRSFQYDIWISIWSQQPVMQRSPCSGKLAAWIDRAIGDYVDETTLKETTDFKSISWTVNRVLLNGMQWKREFCFLSTMHMR